MTVSKYKIRSVIKNTAGKKQYSVQPWTTLITATAVSLPFPLTRASFNFFFFLIKEEKNDQAFAKSECQV